MGRKIENRVGEERFNKNGELMRITEYHNCDDIIVEFQDEYKFKRHTNYSNFKNGDVSNNFNRTYFGIGYLGNVNERVYSKERNTAIEYWTCMLRRAYDDKYKEIEQTYKEVYVCDEWQCFENFEKWFNNNYYIIDGEKMELDKDILLKGNKCYCPEYCIFAPKRINNLFTKNDKKRGKYPIGVTFHREKYDSRCGMIKKRKHLGSFDNPIDAFYAYKKFKEDYIKQIANEYKNKYPNFPQKLYDAMYNYKVEITD